MFLKVLILLHPLVTLIYGGSSDMCVKIELIQNFDAKRTEGIWYAQEASGHAVKYFGDCLKFNITSVKGFTIESKRIDGEYKYENLTIIQEGNTSKYNMKTGSNISYPHYWVVTDYDNFVVYYSCFKGKGTANISTRTREPGNRVMETAKKAMKEKGLNPDKMTAIKQNDCTN